MHTDQKLEQLLRKGPAPVAPGGLEQRLIQQAGRARRAEPPVWSWFSIFQERPWAPALGLFAVAAGLVTVAAFQNETLSELKDAHRKQSARLAAAVERPQPDASQQQQRELETLRKESEELQALRAEMEQIQELLAGQPRLAAENTALRAQLSNLSRNDPASSPEMQAALAEAREKAGRITCVNHLKNIGLAARIWATENGDRMHLPKDFLTMTNELSTPRVLICPADPARSQAGVINAWEQFAAIGSSYEILSPGIGESAPGAVYARCLFHNNVGRVDGSVIQLQPDQQVLHRNGQWEISE